MLPALKICTPTFVAVPVFWRTLGTVSIVPATVIVTFVPGAQLTRFKLNAAGLVVLPTEVKFVIGTLPKLMV